MWSAAAERSADAALAGAERRGGHLQDGSPEDHRAPPAHPKAAWRYRFPPHSIGPLPNSGTPATPTGAGKKCPRSRRRQEAGHVECGGRA